MRFIIKSSYEYEINADTKDEALEKFFEIVPDDYASRNISLLNELCESLYASLIK